ncbi:amino acid racemase [Hellea sp.]|nr:amino acid racemase [Hellea sp.]
MKTLGLIGGTSWHSTVEYYKYINQTVNDHFGDNTNPPLILFTLNQALVYKRQEEGKWDLIAGMITEAALRLEKAGAEQLMLCANTPHKVYELVTKRISTPILHIGDATAAAIKSEKLGTVCFLGTKFSMTEDFVTGRISQHDIDVLVPQSLETINELHRIIQEELTYGKIIQSSKRYVLDVIQDLTAAGAQGIVLGCTEFPLMIDDEDLSIPAFNTAHIHALAGAKYILQDL